MGGGKGLATPFCSLTTSCFLSPAQMLLQKGWNASFEEFQDVDHFEIVWNLTREDFELTQVRLHPLPIL